MLSIAERKSGFTSLSKTDGKKALSVKKQAVNALAPFKDLVHTITNDNGKEFALYKQIAEKLEADIYICHPCSSRERGLNEYSNKLIRQYLSKNQYLRNIPHEYFVQTANQLNHRSRKKLGFKTPMEVFTSNFSP